MSETSTSLRFRDRIGAGPSLGFYPAPHRYHLYLSPGCPLSLRVSITLRLLRLEHSVGTTVLPAPAGTCDALAADALRTAYETTRHHYDGPLTVPALCDRWSGRVVSNHTSDILDDLALHFADPDDTAAPQLRPDALAADIDAIRELLDADPLQDATLDLLDGQLASGPYVLGAALTAADVDVWVALAHPDTAADALRRVAGRERLRSYLRRLSVHPAFHTDPKPEGEREHTAHDPCSTDNNCVGDQSRVAVTAA